MPLARELGEHRERRAHGERRVAPAAHQLQRLRHELDLADAARAELDVAGELAPLDVAPHLGMQRAHGVEGGVVEIFAKHERPHDLRKRAVRSTAQGTRLDAGIALPFAPLRDEIVFQKVEAADERPRIAIRPKPHVDAKDEAVLGGVIEQPDEPARRRRESLGAFGLRMQEHQIDVG